MTEAEWLACADPQRMLEFVRGKVSERKCRLFAVACCRRIWHLLTDERSRRAIEFAELHADEKASELELEQSQWAVEKALKAWSVDQGTALLTQGGASEEKAHAAVRNATLSAWQVVMPPVQGTEYTRDVIRYTGEAIWAISANWNASRMIRDERNLQCRLVRDIFGNPFHSIALDPAWLTWNDATIPKLAQAIYDERAFDRPPILADALEEADCEDADILAHCRSEGPHVKGCWAVDLILGRP